MRLFVFILLLGILSVLSLFVGVSAIGISDIMHYDEEKVSLLLISRIPRTVALILAGIGLSVSGLIMQQLMQNKFVSPTTAGTLDAAKLGLLAAFLIVPQSSVAGKMFFAFAITFAASILFFRIAGRVRYRNVIFIPLVGIVFGNILSAIATFFAYKFNIVQNMNAWLTGDFSGVLQGSYEIIYLSIPAVVITYLYANKFTVAGMGETVSKNLGLNYAAVVRIGLLCVSLTVSVIVLTAGVIPFLGLVVPNIVSLMYGDNLRRTLPYTAVLGALFLVLCDIIGRLVVYPFELPIGMVVGIIGGVLFLIMLIRRKG